MSPSLKRNAVSRSAGLRSGWFVSNRKEGIFYLRIVYRVPAIGYERLACGTPLGSRRRRLGPRRLQASGAEPPSPAAHQ